MSYVVAATYVSKPDTVDGLREHLTAMMEPTRAEEGCEQYTVVNSNDDPRTFLLFEIYRNEEAFQAHGASPHFDEHIRNGAWDLLDSRPVIFGTPLQP